MEDVIAIAWRAEEALLTPAVRGNQKRVASLLAPDFYEIGQSGSRWSREEIVERLSAVDWSATGDFVITEQEAKVIGPGTVLLSYHLTMDSRASRRSALWRHHDGAVQCTFHQGTPLPNA